MVMSILSVLAFVFATNPTPCTLRVAPYLGFAPLLVHMVLTIEPDARNRSVCLFYLSDVGDERSSCWELDGAHAPRISTREATITTGRYEFGLVLYRAGSEIRSARERVVVFAR